MLCHAVLCPAVPCRAALLQVEGVLATVACWQFDAFRLTDVTRNHPLSVLAFFLFRQTGLVTTFGIKGLPLARWVGWLAGC